MGGAQSSEKVQTKYEEKINIITNVEENEDEIFNKISDLTKEILLKYSDMHLDENFCNNLAIIYQNKLDTFKSELAFACAFAKSTTLLITFFLSTFIRIRFTGLA